MGEVHTASVASPEEKKSLEKLGVDGTITLKWIFMRWDGKTWTGLLSLRIGAGGGLL